ncbi:MAG: DNA translocase FtsK 4TM domain-containing protein, partial [Sphingomicrobium sp.]
MATAAARTSKRDLGPDWRDALRNAGRRFALRTWGVVLVAIAIAEAVALASHSSTDPSFSTAAGGPPSNWLGSLGAYSSDALLLLFGLGSALLLPVLLIAGLRMLRLEATGRVWRGLSVAAIGAILIGIALSLTSGSAVSGMPAGWGGTVGLAGAYGLDALFAMISNPSIAGPARLATLLLLGLGGLTLGWLALELRREGLGLIGGLFRRRAVLRSAAPRTTEIRDESGGGAAPPRSRPAVAVAAPAKAVLPAARAQARKLNQPGLALGDSYQLPTVDLLAKPTEKTKQQQIDRAGLERNARLLESVLEDFHVRGDIVEVRPGPVVTMYELEPASGIKASRVIQLADDIARNMSALSARVATIPGRSVIGIELPNSKRESVSLSELVGSQAFEDQNMSLPLILGKNIAGDPVIADLAPMPHLLVAGTTGSGKSVGLNCMILSLLYRYGPDECKLIMIDPKMLELSMYEDIPHLLAPVVTEPGKAIRALKWTVEQMEERYRMMANLGVRALPSFNAKVREAKSKGTKLGRRVQTGYD